MVWQNVIVSLLTGPLQFKFNKPTYPLSRMAWFDLIGIRSPGYEVIGGGGGGLANKKNKEDLKFSYFSWTTCRVYQNKGICKL